MNTNILKRFAQQARIKIIQQVSARLELVLNTDSAELREKAAPLKKLQEAINATSKEQVVDKVAYTWFNRLMALRFMDANDYQPIGVGVVTPKPGHTLPALLDEAKQGNIHDDLQVKTQHVYDLLDGKIPSSNAQNEAYKELLIGACNHLHKIFPFLFERISDYTELLLPDDLISEFSIVNDFNQGMTTEDCQEVEVIGWLYQFYISELNDELISSKKKYEKNELAPASQLFTPKWVVQYMVDNTLGQLWSEINIDTKVTDSLEFYVKPAYKEQLQTRKAKSIEDIKFFEPCVGSGHILSYAFDVFYKMYEEQGYNPTEIPELIITKNLHGVDIDPRAAQLASFVLFMKGRQKHRRFLRSVVKNNIKPNITFYQDFEFDDKFNNASALGSLIKVEPNEVEQLQIDENSLFGAQQAELKKLYTLLGQKYDVVVTNPPYISSSRMEGTLKQYVEANYPETKSDLFATFILRCLELCNEDGLTGYMTPFVWMFISSYEKLRAKVIDNHFINNLIQLEYSGFDGATVPICTFTLRNKNINDGAKGSYIRLSDFKGAQNQAPRTLEAIKNPQCGWFYTANQKDFEKIPEYRLGYWLSGLQIDAFVNHTELKESHPPKAGLSTANNDRFLRFWWEIDSDKFGLNYNSREDLISSKKWIPMTKGGKFKKWFGNNEYVLNFSEDGEELKYWLVNNPNDPSTKSWSRYIRNYNSYCKPGISFSDVSSGTPAFRMQDSGFIPNSRGPFIYSESKELLGFLNSKICVSFLELLSPTLTFNVGDVSRVPFNDLENTRIANDVGKCIEISSQEFYSIERSWYYNQNELIRIKGQDLEESYDLYQQYWQNKFYQLHKNEEELNKQFIEIYGLQEELTPDVPLADITILKEELDQKQLKAISERYKSGWQLVDGGQWVVDSAQSPITNHQLPKLPFNPKEIFKQFISYAVGCMFGRYSLDKEGLILANQGETLEDYVRKVAGDWWIEDGEGNWIFNPKKDIDEYYQELQRAENLATGQENGQGSVYSDEANAQRGTIQSDQSDQKSGSQYTQQHSRGAVQGNEGVYSLSEDSTGIAGGAPDSTTFDHRFGNDTSSPNNSNTNGAGEFEQTNKQPDSQAAQQLPTATHHPLSTNLQAPITFMPDDDNIIPVLDDEWFDDDIAGRFKEFLKVSFGAANYDKNLAFVEECLGKDIRKYFIKDFYADHIKRYKKRPIYWQFSSPKSSFSVLIYMHRYTPDTLSQILNGYLKEYREKLNNRIENVNHLIETGSSSEQTKAAKEKEKIEKVLHELQEYERDILYPLATERIAIDLDDGVLVNYNKFGTAIKAVAGLNDKKTKDKVRKFDWIDVEGIRG